MSLYAIARANQLRDEARLHYHLAELERRLANTVRVGTVHEVDAAKGKARVRIGTDPDGQPVLSPWLKWTERAGVIRSWSPPKVGEQVRVVAPSGEIAQGWLDTGGFSDEVTAPSSHEDEHVVAVGDDVELRLRGEKVQVKRAKHLIDLEREPERMRLHHDRQSIVVIREKRIQLKIRPEPQDGQPAPYHVTIDLETGQILASHPLTIAEDPYPQD